MLSWKRAKADIGHVLRYQKDVGELWQHEDRAAQEIRDSAFGIRGRDEWQMAVQNAASRDPDYQVVRDRVARETDRMKRVAWKNGIAVDMTSFPAPAVGGPVIPINLFDAVLHDNSHGGVERQRIVDAINKTRGAAAERVEVEFWRLVNPLYWLKDALVFLLRLPFLLIETTGFDVAKVEDHLLGKVFKFIELALLVWIVYRLGVEDTRLADVLLELLGRTR